MVASGAAVLLRDRQSEEAEGAELLDYRLVDTLGTIPFDDVRGDLPCDEVLGELPDGVLLLAQLQVHPVTPHF